MSGHKKLICVIGRQGAEFYAPLVVFELAELRIVQGSSASTLEFKIWSHYPVVHNGSHT